MRRMVWVVVVMTIMLASCSASPSGAVTEYLDMVIKYDVSRCKLPDTMGGVKLDEASKTLLKDAMKAALSQVSYKIVESAILSDKAQVKVQITGIDMPTLLKQVGLKATSSNALELVVAATKDPNAPKVTQEIVVQVTRIGKKWITVINGDVLNLGNALMGGVMK